MRKSGVTIVVAANFLAEPRSASFRAADVRRIVMRLHGGNDTGTVDRSVTVPAILDGGAGNDVLRGGMSPAILLGGDGADDLAAGLGRSILIGGNGSDKLKGAGADDILIGGRTTHDANEAALLALLAEWTSARAFSTRVQNLAAGVGANRQYRLKAIDTVLDDLASDSLVGGAGRDWFLSFVGDSLADRGRLDR